MDTREKTADARGAGGRLSCRAASGRRRRCCCGGGDPLHHAIASAACAASAVALLDLHWLAGAAHVAVPGALLASSAILAFAAMLSEASARGGGGGGGGYAGSGPPAEAEAEESPPSPPRTKGATRAAFPAMAAAPTLLAVLAVSAAAAIVLAAIAAPSPFPAGGHPGILDAMAACHSTEAGCGRAAIAGDGAQAHIVAPAPVITTVGVPATVSISGVLPPDARPPARVTIVVTAPGGGQSEYGTMSTPAGRYSLHVPIEPPAAPGTHEYGIAASYDSRDFGAALGAGAVPFTVMVLEPEISRSEAPAGPPAWIEASGAGILPAGFPRADTAGGGGDGGNSGGGDGAEPPPPMPVIDGIVSFNPPLPPPTVSAGQVVEVSFTYTDGLPRESFAHVRGPASTGGHERLAEPAYAGAGGPSPGSYRFIVQPTWQPGEYGIVVAYGADGARDADGATTTAGVLPVRVAAGAAIQGDDAADAAADAAAAGAPATAPPFSCIALFGLVGPGHGAPGPGGAEGGAEGGGADDAARHGRPSGCYAGTVRGVTGPDTLDIDGRPVTLTVSNARGGGGAGSVGAGSAQSSPAADRLRELCPAGSAALVDRDDTLAVDGREPHPTIRAGYYSAVWCLGPDGAPYDGTPGGSGNSVPVNRILMAEGLAEPDPVACLSSERRIDWPECDPYTAVEQAVGGAVSAAIDAVSSATATAGGSGANGGDSAASALGGGDCAIATAAYGTPAAADVQSLREWRDLAAIDPSIAEPALHAYYAVSPAIADMLRDSPHARQAAAAVLSVPAAIASAAAEASMQQLQLQPHIDPRGAAGAAAAEVP